MTPRPPNPRLRSSAVASWLSPPPSSPSHTCCRAQRSPPALSAATPPRPPSASRARTYVPSPVTGAASPPTATAAPWTATFSSCRSRPSPRRKWRAGTP
eukprot:scaffold6371_cov110-Isochrysis_galbana.AAC.1